MVSIISPHHDEVNTERKEEKKGLRNRTKKPCHRKRIILLEAQKIVLLKYPFENFTTF